ncbi:acyltransferase family protein [Pseudonocardia sp. RS010]|uniref:acyltransferase family protein n=1 Tax=Pseudonocardia sp. RS010 TaxID=3385979 RepID=UPI0039A2AFDD
MTTTGAPTSRTRLAHLDGLKVVLVAWVIGGHALLGYSAVGGWAYDEVREVTFAPGVEIGLVAVLGPSGLFVIGLFFFVAGLLTEGAVHRHGPARYVRDRLVRLGLPWLLSALLIWPASVWVAAVSAGEQVSPWWVFTHRDPFLDAGSLWFALVLLVFSIAFAGWTVLRGGHPAPSGALGGGHVAGAAVAIAVATVVVRLAFPARSGQIADLHLWQWPQCLGMFLLGVAAARRGWAVHIPDPIRRACSWITVGVLVALPVVAVASGLHDVARDDGPYLGGWTWQAAATAAVEALLVTCGSIALVGLAERRLHRTGPRARRWSRAAFAAFVVQGPVLMVAATALRPLPAPAEVKAPVVAVVAILVCFWLGGLWSDAARRRRGDRRASAAEGDARDGLL